MKARAVMSALAGALLTSQVLGQAREIDIGANTDDSYSPTGSAECGMPMGYHELNYTDASMRKIKSICPTCWLYHFYDPSSCAVGWVRLVSNQGAVDGVVYLAFTALAFSTLLVWSKRKYPSSSFSSFMKKAQHEFLGVMFASFSLVFTMRLYLGTSAPSASMTSLIALGPLFAECVYLMLPEVLVRAWWKWQQNGAQNQQSIPAPLSRTYAIVSGNAVSAKAATISYSIAVLCMMSYAICAWVLASKVNTAKVSDPGNSEFTFRSAPIAAYQTFFFATWIYSLIANVDSVLAIGTHRLKSRGKSTTANDTQKWILYTGGIIATICVVGALGSGWMISLGGGACPYIGFTGDEYHGGEPFEIPVADYVVTMVLFLSAYLFSCEFFAVRNGAKKLAESESISWDLTDLNDTMSSMFLGLTGLFFIIMNAIARKDTVMTVSALSRCFCFLRGFII